MKLIWALMLGILLISFASAYAPKEVNQNLSFSITSNNATACNVTTMENEEVTILNIPMTKTAQTFYVTIDAGNITQTGEHCFNVECSDGISKTTGEECFDITSNGKEKPSGAVITIFIILFLLLLGFMTYLIIYSFGHALSLDFDIIDLAWNYGGFFVILGMSLFEKTYLGNSDIQNFLNVVIDVGIFTSIVAPTIYFILTLTIGTWMKKRVKGVDF
jgi:hypothetical protein